MSLIKSVHEIMVKWGINKGNNIDKQLEKVIEEVDELAVEVERCLRDGTPTSTDMKVKGEAGDVFFSAIALCERAGVDPVECLRIAIEKNAKKKGELINGTFVKQADL